MSSISKLELSPQCAALLSALRSAPHTSLELRKATGVHSLSARLHDLRVALRTTPFVIEVALIPVPTRRGRPAHVARYTLRRTRRTKRARAARVVGRR